MTENCSASLSRNFNFNPVKVFHLGRDTLHLNWWRSYLDVRASYGLITIIRQNFAKAVRPASHFSK
jgi:hypothetical protein